jgi:hypothetical protein
MRVGLIVLVAAISTIAVACGSSGDGSTFDAGGAGQDGSVDPGTDGGDPNAGNDASFGQDGGDSGPTGTCTPKTCAQLAVECGPQGNGCGQLINCGTCTAPQTCGGGGTPSKCGGASACVPKTCASLGLNCGPVADGCGAALNCGTCTAPQICGGGGVSSVCGGGNACVPTTCAAQNITCGPAGDGCGNVLQCGSCQSGQSCGGGGAPGQCGAPPPPEAGADAGNPCVPTTCAQQSIACGPAGDGCGNQLNCGTCVAPQSCGGGGVPSQCGGVAACVPKTCAQVGATCGPAGDGCGGTLSCGNCVAPQTCGGGGVASQCGGSNNCIPKTCAQLGFNCGPVGDGCGGQLACGSCTAPQFCGGGGPSVCGPTTIGGCDGGTTTLTGYVFDPGNHLPVYNALVYVPVGAVATPQTGVVPTQCGCTAPAAYASAYTGIDGKFTLTNPPVGATVTVVVELGKWQRVFTKAVACGANNLGGGAASAAANLTLPSTHLQGNIPLFAIDTGAVDTMECVLLKMGIAQSEFVNPAIAAGKPTAASRVHLYKGSIYNGGAVINGTTPTEAALMETATVMDSYDVILFPCQGNAGTYNAANGFPNARANLLNYAAVGGRAFTTHYHYDLLNGNGSFSGTANWIGDTNNDNGPDPGFINTGFGRGLILANWLNQPIVYGGTYGQIPVSYVRQDFSSVNAPAQPWMSTKVGNVGPFQVHFTFDTPFNQSPTCGRVVYSDFHVENSGGANGAAFPTECSAGAALTPQEKLLEFMLFDLTSCVSPPTCTPRTCAQQNVSCGPAGDGCGGALNCGVCVSPQTCGGGGVPGQCGGTPCSPRTCAQQNISCGPAGDGCGGSLNCGVCVSPQTCGGGGLPGQCGAPACTPRTCAQQNVSCGPAGDGCGGVLACGNCPGGQSCGGGGVPGQCGAPDAGSSCVPITCASQNISCGPAGDGCGNLLACGVCVSPQTCGGGGVPGQCGAPACTPRTCAQQNLSCGAAGDGCGNTLNCGTCTPPLTCGGGGIPGQCGAPNCTPKTCAQQGFNCGPAGDGCGGTIDCGTCVSPQTCGGGGTSGVCGGGGPR